VASKKYGVSMLRMNMKFDSALLDNFLIIER